MTARIRRGRPVGQWVNMPVRWSTRCQLCNLHVPAGTLAMRNRSNGDTAHTDCWNGQTT